VAGGGMPPAERPVLGPPPPPPPAGLGQSLDENAAAAHAVHGLTTEQAHSLTQQSRGSAGASSRKTYKGAFNFRWAAFANMIHEDPSVLKSRLVGPGPAYKVNEGLIERFFYACWDDWTVCKHNANHKSVFSLTAPTCDTLAKAVLHEVNLQLLEKMQPKLASIKGVRVIEMVLSDLRTSKAEQAVAEMQDIQASAHEQLMPADKIALVTKLLVMDLGDGMQCSLIARFNMAYYFLHSLATASRSEDELGIVQAMEFIRAILEVGPDKAEGTLAHWQILNRGKTNQNGKLVYMAVLMHMNPLLCAPAAGGLLKLFRMCCLRESVQEFDASSDEDYVSPLFNTAVIRSDEAPSKSMPYPSLYAGLLRAAKVLGVHLAKPTHGGRVDACNTASNGGLTKDNADRATRRVNDVQAKSYLVGPPASGLVLWGGGDVNDLRGFAPPQAKAMNSFEVLAVVNLLEPLLYQNAARVAQRLREVQAGGGNRSAAKSQNLYTLKGSSEAALWQAKAAVVQAATRPRGPDGAIMQDSPVVARMFAGNPVYMLSAFHTTAFDDVVLFVRGLEDAYLTDPTAAMGPVIQKLGSAMRATIGPVMAQLVATHSVVEGIAAGAPRALAAPAHPSGVELRRPLPLLPVAAVPPGAIPGKRRCTRDVYVVVSSCRRVESSLEDGLG